MKVLVVDGEADVQPLFIERFSDPSIVNAHHRKKMIMNGLYRLVIANRYLNKIAKVFQYHQVRGPDIFTLPHIKHNPQARLTYSRQTPLF